MEGSWTPAWAVPKSHSTEKSSNDQTHAQSGTSSSSSGAKAYVQNFRIFATILAEKTLKSGSCSERATESVKHRSVGECHCRVKLPLCRFDLHTYLSASKMMIVGKYEDARVQNDGARRGAGGGGAFVAAIIVESEK